MTTSVINANCESLCDCSWEAIIVVMDSRPFRDLHHIIQEYEDERVWVYAEWVPDCTLWVGRAMHWLTSSSRH